MSPLLWLLVATGWLAAIVALMTARRLSRQFAELTKMYWELKYDVGEMKARLRAQAPDETETTPPAARAPTQGFVALSDIKRKP